ncbi:hypothetical protein [Caldithrix abyssi]
MKSTLKTFLPIIVTVLLWAGLYGCRSAGALLKEVALTENSYLLGLTAGGLVENNTLQGVDGASEVDAITGATKTRFNLGVHRIIKVKTLTFESGLDYLTFDQRITYELPTFAQAGQRQVRFSQLRLPLTCNIPFFKGKDGQARLSLKAGASLGCTIFRSVTDRGTLPDYTFASWDYGPTLGIACYPFPAAKHYRLGIYLDLYRGSRIYEDIFHPAEGQGGQSYMKFGIIFQ